jgi:hypothetical protein
MEKEKGIRKCTDDRKEGCTRLNKPLAATSNWDLVCVLDGKLTNKCRGASDGQTNSNLVRCKFFYAAE